MYVVAVKWRVVSIPPGGDAPPSRFRLGRTPRRGDAARSLSGYYRIGDDVDCWEGEESD
ncbi:hypothetical protein [Halorubrum sp. Atlit-26R]|uniref:hypothetical protein n=1 Tax=Halorubrum sp. Atlit-26R TaxID=2282128 RepID=UPI0013147BC3|nr:hypothetical protein [Halorubrum sp. Atlit-26R]